MKQFLNESEIGGSNISIGMTRSAEAQTLSMKWVYSLERYGERHQIDGLYKLRRICKKLFPGISLFSDYLWDYGYGGALLLSAIRRLEHTRDCLYIWGFAEGDLAYLARATPESVTPLAQRSS